MLSPQAARLRAGFGDKRAALGTSPEQDRREWEAATADAALPDGVRERTVEYRPGLWIEPTEREPSGVLLWAHGGGFTSGSARTHRAFGAQLALATGRRVWLTDYRLAPEVPCPVAIQDVVGDLAWIYSDRVHPAQVALGGDSAGGGLVVAALAALREGGLAMPAAAVLLSPWLDLTLTSESMRARDALDPLVSYEGLHNAAQHYLGSMPADDPRASPLFAELVGLPPLLVMVGSDEVLFDDARGLVERATRAGTQAQLVVGEGLWHVWPMSAPDLPEANAALEQIGAFLSAAQGW